MINFKLRYFNWKLNSHSAENLLWNWPLPSSFGYFWFIQVFHRSNPTYSLSLFIISFSNLVYERMNGSVYSSQSPSRHEMTSLCQLFLANPVQASSFNNSITHNDSSFDILKNKRKFYARLSQKCILSHYLWLINYESLNLWGKV